MVHFQRISSRKSFFAMVNHHQLFNVCFEFWHCHRILMSKNYNKVSQKILTLRDLHRKWSAIDIANEIMNRDCRPPQTRYNLLRYIKYTLKRGTIKVRRRFGRPRTARTPEFISMVQNNMENKQRIFIRKTNDLLKREMFNSSYGSVQKALKDDIELNPDQSKLRSLRGRSLQYWINVP